MTLGNDAAPLTRRQARELEQSQAAEAAAQADEQQSKPVPERKKPTDRKPSEKGAAAKAAAAAEKTAADKAQAEADAAEAEADAERAAAEQAEADRVRASRAADTAADTTADRTLSRRELRAVVAARLAAEAAASGEAAADADDADADPVDTSAVTIVGHAPGVAVAPPAKSAVPRPTPDPAPASAPSSSSEAEPLAPVPAPIARSAPRPTPVAGPLTAAEDNAPASGSRLPGLHPPLGHWSVDLDDRSGARPAGRIEPFDDLMARGYGAGGIPTTTNALILPSIPHQGAASGPLADSGEILITGSFDLPRSLGSTGQIPSHFDSSELDHMLDKFDDDGAPNAAAPVKASRAVSTHGSDRNVMEPPKRHLASVPIVLAVTTAALALGVVALFVGGYLLNIF